MEKPIWGIPPVLTYYTEGPARVLKIPVGALRLIEQEKLLDFTKYKIEDIRFKSTKKLNKIKFKGTLRDYQDEAVNSFTNKTVGILEAVTGSGKTIIVIAHICKLKQPTLILVNTVELLNQFIERLTQFTNLKKEDIGKIGSGNYIIKPVTVALLQSMHKLTPAKYVEVNKMFGQVITDEVHIISAHTYYKVITSLCAKYKFGLSATPKRPDGLTKVIFFATGPIIHSVDDNKTNKEVLLPKLVEIETDYDYPLFDSDEYQDMVSDLALDPVRNKKITDYHNNNNDNNEQSAFLCTRIAQAQELKKLIPDSAILSSKIPKKKREEIMLQLSKNKLKAVITTYALFSTGIDLTDLTRLYLCAPIRSEIKLIQSAGRIRRKGKKGKQPLIIDFVDKNIGILKNQWYNRRRIWKKLRIL